MDKKLYITRKISDGNGRLEYYLTEKIYKDTDGKECGKIFGVEVTKTGRNAEGIEWVQTETVDDLSVSKECVLEFIYLLNDMEVMPVGLNDVVEDLIQEDFFILNEKREKAA